MEDFADKTKMVGVLLSKFCFPEKHAGCVHFLGRGERKSYFGDVHSCPFFGSTVYAFAWSMPQNGAWLVSVHVRRRFRRMRKIDSPNTHFPPSCICPKPDTHSSVVCPYMCVWSHASLQDATRSAAKRSYLCGTMEDCLSAATSHLSAEVVVPEICPPPH